MLPRGPLWLSSLRSDSGEDEILECREVGILKLLMLGVGTFLNWKRH